MWNKPWTIKEREAIRKVMRWAGPRMIWYAPKDIILHILKNEL